VLTAGEFDPQPGKLGGARVGVLMRESPGPVTAGRPQQVTQIGLQMNKDPSSNVVGMQAMDDRTATWVQKERSISRETLDRLGVGSGTAFFPELQTNSPAVFFPYEDGGWKARAISEKGFVSRTGTEATFWGLRDVLNGPMDTVYIVEGEFDRCAMVEAGVKPNCILAAPGASGAQNANLQYVKVALGAGLSRVKKFILMTDSDRAGLELRTALAQVLGFGRCWFVEWPDNVKDANDFLRSDGPGALLEIAENGRTEWPTYGLYRLSELPEQPPLRRWHPGIEAWGDRIFLAPNTISVATGHPGHGKTQLWAQIWFNIVKNYDLMACIATFETRARPHYQRMLRQFYGENGLNFVATEQIKEADKWIDGHYRFLQHPEQRPTLEWLLNQSEAAVVRHGVKIIQIDPFNRLESQREQGERETDYIGRCLRGLYEFATDMQVHVQILAHPSKTDQWSRGKMPTLEDIHGSKHWDNMPDQGFVIWRPSLYDENGVRQTYAELHHLKARFDDLGYPSRFGLKFNTDLGRYETCQLENPREKKATKKGEEGEKSDD
jgi:twinkle protein